MGTAASCVGNLKIAKHVGWMKKADVGRRLGEKKGLDRNLRLTRQNLRKKERKLFHSPVNTA